MTCNWFWTDRNRDLQEELQRAREEIRNLQNIKAAKTKLEGKVFDYEFAVCSKSNDLSLFFRKALKIQA